VFSTYRGSNPVTDTTGQTLIKNESRMGMSKKEGASSVSMDWESGTTQSSPSCWIIASMKSSVAPTSTPSATPAVTDTITYTPSATHTGTVYPSPTPSNTVVPSPTPTQALIQFDAASGKGGDQWGSDSLEWTHTAYGSNRIVLVFVKSLSSTTVTATYDGNSMTPVYNSGEMHLLYLMNPPTGAKNVSVSLSSSSKVAAIAVSYTGVDQNNPIGNYLREGDEDVTISSSISELVVGAGSHKTTTSETIGVGYGQTERIEIHDTTAPNNVRVYISVSDESGPNNVHHSYVLGDSNQDTAAISLKPYLGYTPTPTITNTPTQTYTPSSTPSPTQTGTINPTPTPTDPLVEPTPNPLESAQYTYDGDGKMVKSVVNGVTTYYIGKIYELEGETERKYYSLGGQRFAVREGETLNWMLSDHLGSTSISTHTDGSWRGEIAYTPFGEMRTSRGVTLADYRYTGQRLDGCIKLIDMGARRYDPALGTFISADTIIPNLGNPLAMDRYAYVYNNPIRYTDPSGHIGVCSNCYLGPMIEGVSDNIGNIDLSEPSGLIGFAYEHGIMLQEGYRWGYLDVSENDKWNGTLGHTSNYGGLMYGDGLDEKTAYVTSNAYETFNWLTKAGDTGPASQQQLEQLFMGIMAHESEHAYQYALGKNVPGILPGVNPFFLDTLLEADAYLAQQRTYEKFGIPSAVIDHYLVDSVGNIFSENTNDLFGRFRQEIQDGVIGDFKYTDKLIENLK